MEVLCGHLEEGFVPGRQVEHENVEIGPQAGQLPPPGNQRPRKDAERGCGGRVRSFRWRGSRGRSVGGASMATRTALASMANVVPECGPCVSRPTSGWMWVAALSTGSKDSSGSDRCQYPGSTDRDADG